MRSPFRDVITEKIVRDHLVARGYLGESLVFDAVDLVAMERPGWVQVYRFTVTARRRGEEPHTLHGAVRDDERQGERVAAFRTRAEQDELLARWCAGLLVLRRREYSRGVSIFLLLFWLGFLGLLVAAFLGAPI